ncbi:hypothetical protein LCGC14_1880320, partial [marine sediment metagenome]
ISFFTFIQLNWNFNDFSSNLNSPAGFELFDELKISDFSSNFVSTGENINITLHQSYLNTSFDTIVNTSIVNGNNFTLPSPKDIMFNSTYTNITVKDIIAPNKSLIIEDDFSWQQSAITKIFTSFESPSNGYLENVSISLQNPNLAEDYEVQLYEGVKWTWATVDYIRYNPLSSRTIGTYNLAQTTGSEWLDISKIHMLLNTSDTYNNTFFIAVTAKTSGDGNWDFENQVLDGSDDTICWDFGQNTPASRDQLLKVDLSPLNNTPNPEDIGLKINNEYVTGYSNINGTGYWESSIVNGSNSGVLKYNVSADWWDVECNITQVQINYTRTDLKASSTFEISGSGQNVAWNVTRNGGLNYFDSDFNDYKINFTVPAIWYDNSIQVFNGVGNNRTSTIIKRLLNNGYRDIEIPNAINGTYWFLNATSNNLISSIDTYVGGVSINDVANYTNIVRFNTTFSEIVKKGNLNLSLYSPAPNYLNHTNIVDISILNPDIEFNVSDWDISNNASQYGVFITYIAWNNGTAAGFLIGNLTILGETELKFINLPSLTFDASDIFNITSFFNDTGYIRYPPKNISDAFISYSINSNPYRNDNISVLGNGLYNITIDCNDTEFTSNGLNSIVINASKLYYYNQSKNIDIIILGETSLTIVEPSNGANYDSSDIFNITLKYNNTLRNEIINTPTINYSLDGGSTYRWDSINSIGDNKYNITVNCNDTQFGNYGLQNIIVNTSKSYYYNQSESFSITITGNTALTFTKWPNQSFYYSDETFNVTAYYFDTSRDQALTGAAISVNIQGEGVYDNKYISEIGNGYYNITVNCSESVFNRYGSFTFQI